MSEKSLARTHHAAFTMAALLGGGGAYAFFMSGSKASLIAGGLLSLAYLTAGNYAQKGEYLLSNQIAAIAGATLTAGMGYRYLATKSMVPLILSSVGAASTFLHARHWWLIEPPVIKKAAE